MHKLLIAIALAFLAQTARVHAAPTLPPLATGIDIELLDCDRETLRRALARVLGRELTGPPATALDVAPRLMIRAMTKTSIELVFYDESGGRLVRHLERAPDCDITIQWVSRLAENLTQDQAGELLALLSPVKTTAAASSEQVSATRNLVPPMVSTDPSISPSPASSTMTSWKRPTIKERAGADHWGFAALAGLGLEGNKLATPGGRVELSAVYRGRYWSIGPKLMVGGQSAKITVTTLPLVAELRVAPLVPVLLDLGVGLGFDYQKSVENAVMGTTSKATDRLVADVHFVGTIGYPVSRSLDLIARIDYDIYLPLQAELGTFGLTAGLRGRLR